MPSSRSTAPLQAPAEGVDAAEKPTRRRERELHERRRDLLSATRKLLRKGGAAAVTMRAVADAVGVSTTVVYALFADKAALIAQAVDDDLKRFSRHLQHALDEAGDARDALQRVAQAYVAFGVAHPQSYRLMFMEARPASPVEDSSIEFGNPSEDAYALARTLVAGLLHEHTGAPASQEAIDVAAQLLWEGLHGITSLRITLADDPWFERLPLQQHVQRMVQVFVAGLLHGA